MGLFGGGNRVRLVRQRLSARRVPAILLATAAALCVGTTMFVAGDRQQAVNRLVELRNSPVGRTVAVEAAGGEERLSVREAEWMEQLSTIEVAVAVSQVSTGALRPSEHAGSVSILDVYGSESCNCISITAGRMPANDSEVVLVTSPDHSEAETDFAFQHISVDGEHISIVGIVRTTAPMSSAEGLYLRLPEMETSRSIRSIRLLIQESSSLQAAVDSLLATSVAPGQRSVQADLQLDVLQAELVDDAVNDSVRLLSAALGFTALAALLLGLEDAHETRKIIGLHRALGANRSQLVAITLMRILTLGVVGVSVGSMTSIGLLAASLNVHLAIEGVALLGVSSCLVLLSGSLPGLFWSLAKDPLLVLRTP